MSQITILVIDDSATIRRLVDSTLSPDGYRASSWPPMRRKGLKRRVAERPHS